MSYPQTTQAAQRFARTMQQLLASRATLSAERLEVATVMDTSNHLGQQYVVGTIGKASIRIFGAPLGTLVAGMKVYVRTVTQNGVMRAHYVSQAPGVQWGYASGGVQVTTPPALGGTTSAALMANKTNIANIPSVTSAGYYWGFFLYIPNLPSSTCCLFETDITGKIGGTPFTYPIQCLYTPQGVLSLQHSTAGYSTTAVTPHNLYYLVWQLGPGANWFPIYLNGSSSVLGSGATVTQGMGGSGSVGSHNVGSLIGLSDITFSFDAASITACTVTYFNSVDLSMPCPLGTWMSKFTFGYALANSLPLAPITQMPYTDDLLPFGNAAAGQGIQTIFHLLCAGDVGTSQLTDSSGNSNTFTIGANLSVVATGPY